MTETETYFEPADPVKWSAMVDKILRGATMDSLTRMDEDGLATQAFYPVVADTDHRPPLVPARPADRLANGWDICQPLAGDSSNGDILEALASGATALSLANCNATIIAAHLDTVFLPAITLGFDAPDDPQALHAAILDCAGKGDFQPDALSLDLGIDAFAGAGSAPMLTTGTALAANAPPSHRLLRVDGWTRHNQGLTAAQELGFILAGIAEILRAGDEKAMDPMQMAARLSVRLALPADMFAGIARCRAMRILWDGILGACGVAGESLPPLWLQGYAGLRMMSVLDSEVNMLRTTTALLGGAIGGADSLAGFGHDVLTGETPAAARLVRMTQAMMIAESQLATTLDPVAGASFLEARTDALAAAGWAAFQDIEREGGLLAVLASGMIDAQAASAAEQRDVDLRSGGTDLVGVTLQPRSETISVPLARFDAVRRPAALVEQLRHAAAARPARILLLRGSGDAAAADERTVRRWLDIAGMQAVLLPEDDVAGISAARPDCIISCGVIGAATASAINDNIYRIAAADLAAATDKIAMLESMLPAGGVA